MAKKKADPTVKKRLKAGRVAALDLLIEEGGGGGTAIAALPEFDPDASPLPDFESPDDFNVEKILNESGEASIPVDLKFDDSSMPTAKNFFEWVSSSNYLAATPYLEQALIGIRLFGEYCVASGSWIQTSDGFKRIEDAVGNPTCVGMRKMKTATVSVDGIKEVAYGGMTSKRRRCLRVTYASGKSIVVTPEHRALQLNEDYTFSWVRADSLKIGAYGVSKAGADLWPHSAFSMPAFELSGHANASTMRVPTSMTDELARFLGYVMSDGHISRNGVEFVSLDASGLADDFAHCTEVVFGLTARVERGNMRHNSTRPYARVRVNCRDLVAYLASIGMEGKSYDKTVPDCIMQSTRQHVVEFLRAVMDCDGYSDYKIGISLSSPDAVKRISLLMENLGLYGHYREHAYDANSLVRGSDARKDARGTWTCNAPRSLYRELIGTRNHLRVAGLESPDVAGIRAGEGTAYAGSVPFGKSLYATTMAARNAYHEAGIGRRKFGRREYVDLNVALDDEDFVSFTEARVPTLLSRLRAIKARNLTFTQIVKIEDAGFHTVYDLTVPEGENFQCDGMIVHNCPSCSDTEWMHTENHEPSEGIVGLLNKVTLLEHGVCPKCKAKRSTLFKKRKLNLYNELAVCAGQRCVTGDTLLTTDMGLRRVRDLPVNGDDSVMSDLNVMLNNKACRVHKVLKDTDCNRLVAANLSNGMSLRGTADHGVEGWAFSYRPLSDCGRSPIVVNLGTHDSKPFPTKEFVLGLHAKYKTSGVVTRGAHFSCGEDFMLPVIAELAKGNVRVVGNRPYLDGDGVTLSRNIALQHLVAAHMRDDVLAELPDYVLTQPRETLAVFFASLFELGEVTVVSEQLARDIQVLAVGCNQPIIREGCTLIRDRAAYDDFSPLAETVQRVCPEFAPPAWDRATLVTLLADVQESDPLYYLKRLVDGKFAVFTAEVEQIDPEPVWTFEVPSGQRYVSNGMVSENSGKSIVVAMLSTYITHLLLKVQKPTRLFNVGDNQILHGTFVALTLAQAKDTLWDPYYGYLLDSPWFQRYHALIRRLEALHGVEVLKLRDTFVLYRHRNLYVYAAGPDKRVLRGRTRFLAAIDEIGYFDNNAAAQKVKTGAAEVHIALERSLLTVRANEQRLVDEGCDNLLTGYMLNVSSPSDYRDKICELVRLSQSSRKILGIHAPTWKMNPHIPRDNEIIVDAFQRDPMTAARDYGAQPPVSASPFISPVVVNDSMREVGRNEVEYTHQLNRASNAGIQERTIYGVVTRIKETDVPSVLAIDAGETNNSFALSCTSTREGMASIDLLIEIMPSPGVALNYTMIFDYLIVPVIKARNVRILLADRWNSTKLLQDALATSLVDVSKKYSLKYNDMWDVKNQMQGGTLSYPRSTHVKSVTDILNSDLSDYPECFKGRPVEHFMYQCVTIQDSRNQVLKGQGLTDDLWRASALSVYGINNPDWAPFLVPRKNTNMNRDPSRLMVMGAGQRTAGGGSSVATKSGEVGNFACVAGSRRLKR